MIRKSWCSDHRDDQDESNSLPNKTDLGQRMLRTIEVPFSIFRVDEGLQKVKHLRGKTWVESIGLPYVNERRDQPVMTLAKSHAILSFGVEVI